VHLGKALRDSDHIVILRERGNDGRNCLYTSCLDTRHAFYPIKYELNVSWARVCVYQQADRLALFHTLFETILQKAPLKNTCSWFLPHRNMASLTSQADSKTVYFDDIPLHTSQLQRWLTLTPRLHTLVLLSMKLDSVNFLESVHTTLRRFELIRCQSGSIRVDDLVTQLQRLKHLTHFVVHYIFGNPDKPCTPDTSLSVGACTPLLRLSPIVRVLNIIHYDYAEPKAMQHSTLTSPPIYKATDKSSLIERTSMGCLFSTIHAMHSILTPRNTSYCNHVASSLCTSITIVFPPSLTLR
jgi:hypothetical protein